MALLSSLPPELLGQVAGHLEPLPRVPFLKALKGRIPLLKPILSTSKIWGLIFKSDKWVNRVLQTQGGSNQDPTVSLVGADLEKVYHRGQPKRAYLVLAIHDWTGDTTFFRDAFFESLQEHKYDKARSEVYLTGSGITLHVGDVVKSDEWLYMSDPSRIFRLRTGKLSTNVIYYMDDTISYIGPESIGGIRDYPVRRKKAIRQICSIKLEFRGGTPVYRVFISFSKSVRVVNIQVTDNTTSKWVAQWRVAQPNEREWWP